MAEAAGIDLVVGECSSIEFPGDFLLLQQALNSLNGITVYPSCVNSLLVRSTGAVTSGELQQALRGNGILIRDCTGFTGLTDRFFRVAVRTAGENDRLVAALRTLLV